MKFSNKYPLKPFQNTGFQKAKKVIDKYPLATLVSQNTEFPTVSQVPLIWNENGEKLLGHFDKNNPHCEHILNGGNIYCIFNGPNHYITPTIYPDEQFPGWNYITVHIKGKVKSITDTDTLTDILLRTTEHNEPKNSGYKLSPHQTNFDIFIKLILGFEIEIIDVKGVFKLAQDKGQPHISLAKAHLNKVCSKNISGFLDEL